MDSLSTSVPEGSSRGQRASSVNNPPLEHRFHIEDDRDLESDRDFFIQHSRESRGHDDDEWLLTTKGMHALATFPVRLQRALPKAAREFGRPRGRETMAEQLRRRLIAAQMEAGVTPDGVVNLRPNFHLPGGPIPRRPQMDIPEQGPGEPQSFLMIRSMDQSDSPSPWAVFLNWLDAQNESEYEFAQSDASVSDVETAEDAVEETAVVEGVEPWQAWGEGRCCCQ